MTSDKKPISLEANTEPKKVITKSRSVSLPTTIAIVVVVATTAFVGGTRAESLHLPWFSTLTNSSSLDFSRVQQVYDKLKGKFAEGPLDTNKLVEGAERGLVAAAGDPYTVYFSAAEAKAFDSDLNGTFTGIGAELAIKDNALVVQSVLDNSPAKKAGLQTGDVIAKVNDDDTTGWPVEKAVSKIRGDKGTTVKLTIIRAQKNQEFNITRDTITDPSVKYTIENNIGYMRISRFASTDTSSLSRSGAEAFKAAKVKGVVLDLRGNGGGYVTAAQDVASLWLGSGKTVVTERKDGKTVDELKTSGSAVLEGVPTIVLIDGGSASASEIVAGALHDYKAATLVGVKSFGKGSVQEIQNLTAGAELKVTVALWYTPNGKNINKQGIEPDMAVALSDQDVISGNDTQKAKAIELLNK